MPYYFLISSTLEAESDHKVPFLDIHVDNTGPTVVTSKSIP